MFAAPQRFTALVLAGSRGAADPVAAACNVPHKALAPVLGEPMLWRVVRALQGSGRIRRIVLQSNAPALFDAIPGLRQLIAAGQVEVLPAAASPAQSVAQAMAALAADLPVLVTTADHPLLTPAMIDHFCDQAAASGAEIAVGLAPASTVLAQYPGALRTFYRLGGERWSGCNLFALLQPGARKAIEFWVGLERHRKRPWRLIAAIGLRPLLVYLGRPSLERAMAELSRIVGVEGRAVAMPFAEAPIDVDKPEDLKLVEEILKTRGATHIPSPAGGRG
ncbi:MAG: NTP transferase domain-containing protein [Reyranellaceae bacterium]